jgi:hypothetical protein
MILALLERFGRWMSRCCLAKSHSRRLHHFHIPSASELRCEPESIPKEKNRKLRCLLHFTLHFIPSGCENCIRSRTKSRLFCRNCALFFTFDFTFLFFRVATSISNISTVNLLPSLLPEINQFPHQMATFPPNSNGPNNASSIGDPIVSLPFEGLSLDTTPNRPSQVDLYTPHTEPQPWVSGQNDPRPTAWTPWPNSFSPDLATSPPVNPRPQNPFPDPWISLFIPPVRDFPPIGPARPAQLSPRRLTLPPEGPPPAYDEVHALLLYWEEDNLGVESEVCLLETVFAETYQFTSVTKYIIPSANSSDLLLEQIDYFRDEYSSPANLLIVYYAGHGGRGPRNWL